MTAPDPKAVELDIGALPEAGVSEAVVLSSEYETILLFSATRKVAESRHSSGTAQVKFKSCSQHIFGYPNDEALAGHPLYKAGLGYYGVYEILHSEWAAKIAAENRVSFPATSRDKKERHFVFTFHDSTFECLAQGLEVAIFPETVQHRLVKIAESLFTGG